MMQLSWLSKQTSNTASKLIMPKTKKALTFSDSPAISNSVNETGKDLFQSRSINTLNNPSTSLRFKGRNRKWLKDPEALQKKIEDTVSKNNLLIKTQAEMNESNGYNRLDTLEILFENRPEYKMIGRLRQELERYSAIEKLNTLHKLRPELATLNEMKKSFVNHADSHDKDKQRYKETNEKIKILLLTNPTFKSDYEEYKKIKNELKYHIFPSPIIHTKLEDLKAELEKLEKEMEGKPPLLFKELLEKLDLQSKAYKIIVLGDLVSNRKSELKAEFDRHERLDTCDKPLFEALSNAYEDLKKSLSTEKPASKSGSINETPTEVNEAQTLEKKIADTAVKLARHKELQHMINEPGGVEELDKLKAEKESLTETLEARCNDLEYEIYEYAVTKNDTANNPLLGTLCETVDNLNACLHPSEPNVETASIASSHTEEETVSLDSSQNPASETLTTPPTSDGEIAKIDLPTSGTSPEITTRFAPPSSQESPPHPPSGANKNYKSKLGLKFPFSRLFKPKDKSGKSNLPQ